MGKLATGTIFSPPWKFVKDELRSFDYSLSLFLSVFLFLSLYIFCRRIRIYVYEFCELKISGFRNIPIVENV